MRRPSLALSQAHDVQGSPGGYPERILPWLVTLPLPCCVQPLLHCSTCTRGQQPPGEVLTLCYPPLQFVSSGGRAPLPDICDEWAVARVREKQKKTADRKREVVGLCWESQRTKISSKALLQKDVRCLTSVQRPWIASGFCKPHCDMQGAMCLWRNRSVEMGRRKRDLVDICLPETCSLSPRSEWVGLIRCSTFHHITGCPQRKSERLTHQRQ